MLSIRVLFRAAVAGLSLLVFAGFEFAGTIENTPPTVKIISPLKSAKFQWNSNLQYSISVVDQEDGSSAYDEISVQQVFMSIRFLPDSSRLKDYLRTGLVDFRDVLLPISSTTCFNCHQMKSKLMGPSFESISKKYPNTEASVVALATKVIKGTSGTWGDVQMPPHPDLKPETVQQMVRWILNNGGDQDQDHIRGLEGTFRTRMKPEVGSSKAVYVLTATYIDSGDKSPNNSRKIGQHTLVLKSKD